MKLNPTGEIDVTPIGVLIVQIVFDCIQQVKPGLIHEVTFD